MGSLRKTTELSFLNCMLYSFLHVSEKVSSLGTSIEHSVAQLLLTCFLVGLKCEQVFRFWKGCTGFLISCLHPKSWLSFIHCSEPGAILPQRDPL